MLQRAASNAYSWWWASHIRTKQSKWLDSNLQEMEERVKSMLKIVEEDADSFAKRAEMYYKRRPELINFVEEAYRAYRALAERYDHISRELHKANHTIATAFPDQVQFGMQDEDDYSSPKAITPLDSTKIPKPPAEIPQMSFRNKSIKKQSATKKPQQRKITSADKDKAQEEIDRLQKRILVLQTEKEFIKCSYESGLAKYWEIEKQVSEMQEEVCCLQDEFSASAVIEDDEARALLATTALKSCKNTLMDLQEQQKRSSELARIESKRIEDAKEKLKALKGDYGRSQMKAGEVSGENEEASMSSPSMEEEAYDLKQERLELELLCEKVGKHFDASSDLSVSELAEKIDELVNKVISLEMTISSQTVQIDRLRSETDGLQKHMQILEEEKLALIDDSNVLSDKLWQAEQELQRIQDLEKYVQDERKVLITQFTEACHSLNDLSEKLQSPIHQDAVNNAESHQGGEISPVKVNSVGECKEEEVVDSQDIEGTSVDEKPHQIQEPGICFKELDDHVSSATASQLEDDLEKPRDPGKEITKIHDTKENVVEEEAQRIQSPFSSLKDKGTHIQSGAEHQLKNNSEISEDCRKEVAEVHKSQKNLNEEVCMTQEPHFGPRIQENNAQTLSGSQLENVLAESTDLGKEIKIQDRDELINGKDHVMHEHSFSLRIEENIHREEPKLEHYSDSFKIPKQKDQIGERDSLLAHESIHPSTQLRDQEGTLNLQQLLLNGLEGREKILLSEYTSILRSYKETKKRLSEAERKNQHSHFEAMTQIRELKSANAMKDEEIQLLRQKLSSLQAGPAENPLAQLVEVEDPSHCKLESISSFPRLMAVSSSSRRLFSRTLKGINVESEARRDVSFDIAEIDSPFAEDGIKLVHVGEPPTTLALEEKFRRDIDALLEENLEFWFRVSTTFHHVQKFQATFEDLDAEVGKLKDSKAQEGSSSGGSESAAKPETAPIDKKLRELKTELQVWLEQNAILRGELQTRFASLRDIQEEISNVLKSSETEELQFTPYQASKFQGEVLNMLQENNKVADELQAGLDHVRALQLEVEKALSKLHENFELHRSRSNHHHHHFKHFSSKARIPLRSLLFGVKTKKPSIFSCMNPAMQKQFSDLRAAGLQT